jgi:hypothetical protein
VTSWLGNSRTVANNHYAMTMHAGFDRAVVDGAKIGGVTTTVKSTTPKSSTHCEGRQDHGALAEKVHRTLQVKGGKVETRKKPIEENPVNNWVCLQSALAVLPLSYPASVLTEFGKTRDNCEVSEGDTQQCTQVMLQFASVDQLGNCLWQLDGEHRQALMSFLSQREVDGSSSARHKPTS